ncbi:MAG: sortase [Tenericutes bacterium]|nr:sortase [Mycoplasmatota bacterium]
MKYLKLAILFFILTFSITAYGATKEDIISLSNSVSTCSGSTGALIKGFKNSYTRMLNERDISSSDLDIIYSNISKAISIINSYDVCSSDGKKNIPSNVKSELYSLYNNSNSIILSSPKITDKKEENNEVKTTTKVDSNLVIDKNNEEVKIYDNGVLTNVIKTTQKLNYVGTNKVVKITIISLLILLIAFITLRILKINPLLNNSLIYCTILLLTITTLFRENITLGLDVISLMNVNEKIANKEATVIDKKIVSYPTYGTKYGTIYLNNESDNIYFGDSVNILKQGVGTSSLYDIPGDKEKVVLSGHNTGIFKNLSNLKNGNKIIIETNYAKFEYIVKTSKIVNETDLNSLEKDYDLILYTCYPNKELYGNKRLIIYAKLDKTKWVGES